MVDIAITGSDGKGHGLLCPTCRVDLVMSERQGIEIDYCPKCRGVWLDRGELDKIIEKSASEAAGAGQKQPFPSQPASGQSYPSQDPYDRDYSAGHGGRHGQRRRHGSFLERLFD